MTQTECGKGHIYDSDLYATCPYCNGAQKVIHFTKSGSADGVQFGQDVYSQQETVAGDGGAVFGRSILEDDTPTMAPEEYRREHSIHEEIHTRGDLQNSLGFDPVVGWLVCIEGRSRGQDWRLLGRINTIGSSESMDVCIKGDPGISQIEHARLGYDPKNNRFRLIPAQSTNNIYLNDDVVDVPTQLAPYDVIEFGETKLLFLPLCTEHFNWKTGLCSKEGDNK